MPSATGDPQARARDLIALSYWPTELGRREEALAADNEAVTIRRQLAGDRPDAFLPHLAMSLNNQSNRLADLGRREEALAAIEEAVTIRRQLASSAPQIFLPSLAAALRNLAIALRAVNRQSEAEQAETEAAALIGSTQI